MNIRDFIPEGRDNAISRRELEIRTGLKDREIRKLIELSVSSNEAPIINNGKGYFIMTDEPEDVDEAYEYICAETARTRKIERKIRKMRKYLEHMYQMKFEI